MSDQKREKATILYIGFIDPFTKIPHGWGFDLRHAVPAFEILDDTTILYGGYTVDELIQAQKDFLKSPPNPPPAVSAQIARNQNRTGFASNQSNIPLLPLP